MTSRAQHYHTNTFCGYSGNLPIVADHTCSCQSSCQNTYSKRFDLVSIKVANCWLVEGSDLGLTTQDCHFTRLRTKPYSEVIREWTTGMGNEILRVGRATEAGKPPQYRCIQWIPLLQSQKALTKFSSTMVCVPFFLFPSSTSQSISHLSLRTLSSFTLSSFTLSSFTLSSSTLPSSTTSPKAVFFYPLHLWPRNYKHSRKSFVCSFEWIYHCTFPTSLVLSLCAQVAEDHPMRSSWLMLSRPEFWHHHQV